MTRRQTMPTQWLIVDLQPSDAIRHTLGRLPLGTGLLFLQPPVSRSPQRLRTIARHRNLAWVIEAPGTAARVHNQRELTRAMLRRAKLILVSPIHETASHPEWKPLPRMRAATLARLANRRAIALGGMNSKRYANVAPLGFIGWAGISAFRI
jgi:hypothetical protein